MSGDKQEKLLTTSQFQSKIEPSSFSMSCMWSLSKHAETFTVVDNMQFQMWNNNATKTIQMVIDVHIDRYKKKLHVTILLTGLKIWTERNLVKISLNSQETLQNFNC